MGTFDDSLRTAATTTGSAASPTPGTYPTGQATPTSPDDTHHPLTRYGWDQRCADAFAPYADQGLPPARVVRVDRGSCEVVTVRGGETVRVRAAITPRVPAPSDGPTAAADPTRLPCTGDWAALAGGDTDEPGIAALLPRHTAFLRSAATRRSEGQVLAANIDRALIAVPLSPEPEPGRVERFVSLAWSSGAEPLLVLTKADLLAEPARALARADVASWAPGVRVLTVSATTGDGTPQLAEVLAHGTTALLGPSGAGKSTLVNVLLGEETRQVRAVRDRDGKGRHTTTTRDLAPLPHGGVLIDTPGLRGVGLWDAEDGVSQVFAEIEELAVRCRFHDCAHRTEPGCAVRAALADGTLSERRLASYRKLLRENARLAARTDARLRAAMRREWKQKQALGRHLMERKRGGGRGRRD